MTFPETSWTILAEATLNGGESEKAALGKMCERYWTPIASVMKARNVPAERIDDLTQDFFLSLMEGGFFRRADRGRGKFRSFLLNALRNFLADDARKTLAQKRGGGFERVELREDSSTYEDDELRFDQAWAATLFDAAVLTTGEEVKRKRGEEAWQALQVFLTGEGEMMNYTQLGRVLELSEGGAKSEVSRMRASFREHLRREVAMTVSAPHEIDEELTLLRDVMMRRPAKDNA
ncbi:MAG: ECF-type sigma factor [Verrucomicrobiota bacterium JB023]|nr:ECF-type sigma factor [Verrucomicrobiota bacterium JB023]